MATNLDPQTLQQILAMLQTQQRVGTPTPGGMSYWSDPSQTYDPTTDTHGFMLGREYGWDRVGEGEASSEVLNGRDRDYIMRLIAGADGGMGERWDTNGNYLGTYEAQDGGGRQFNQAALMFGSVLGGNLAMANGVGGGANAATSAAWSNGAGLGGDTLSAVGANGYGMQAGGLTEALGGATTAGGMTASQQAAMMAANGMTDAEIAAALGSTGANSAGLTGVTGATTAGTTAAATGTQLASNAKTAADVASTAKTGTDLLTSGKNVAALVGGAAGLLDSGDKEQTTSRDPWSAAQPYLKGLLAEGADIYNQRKAEPFSQSQQAGYTNIGGLLDLVNNNAGGLLAGPQANASGRNQFVRGRQQGLLGSTFEPTAEQWRPQQFGDMGMTKYRGGR